MGVRFRSSAEWVRSGGSGALVSAQTLAAGHAFVQNLRRGHYEIATDEPTHHRLRIAFNALAASI